MLPPPDSSPELGSQRPPNRAVAIISTVTGIFLLLFGLMSLAWWIFLHWIKVDSQWFGPLVFGFEAALGSLLARHGVRSFRRNAVMLGRKGWKTRLAFWIIAAIHFSTSWPMRSLLIVEIDGHVLNEVRMWIVRFYFFPEWVAYAVCGWNVDRTMCNNGEIVFYSLPILESLLWTAVAYPICYYLYRLGRVILRRGRKRLASKIPDLPQK